MKLPDSINALTPQKRSRLLLALVVAGALVFLWLPSASELRRAIPEPIRRLYPGDPSARPVKPSPFDVPSYPAPRAVFPQRAGELAHAATPASLPPVNGNARPVAPEAPNVALPDGPVPVGLLGKYEGRTLLRKRKQVCIVSVELGADAEGAGQVAAASTMQCMDPLAPYAVPGAKTGARDAMLALAGRYLPVESHLTGVWQNGALHLSVQKIVGDNDDCVMTSATLTPWSVQQVEFEWEDGCGKGDMLLAKALK
jgi:hypothetical protein